MFKRRVSRTLPDSHFKKHGVEDKDIVAAGVAARMSRKPK
jgi:hypothetical protein